ncbi:M15 family metallopeptidase [Nocardioides sp. cx-169]|uniref:M15 family metallopeptidase n=1 Tax=Nocardioides sp. cx-169 TaxID=2899080 RepID=UPI001E2833CB|nr:M15 family metallopeptidase [Nocardioides sp. cx-169]MCD4532977.1 M15 family metallopeptidase [Nocardioides sp. cx-169]
MRVTRALAATATVVVLAIAPGCGASGGDEPKADPSTPASADPDPSPSRPEAPAIDPAMAMDPPGPREGALQSSDMILLSREPFSEEDVAAISAVEGVQRVVQFSHSQVPIENRLLNVAAVDPTTYRNYTPLGSADLQDVWDRVAGGEFAVDRSLAKRLPTDESGFLRFGAKEGDPLIHLGATIDQAPFVDVVVNEKWVEPLGMKPGNALLVGTGVTSPYSVRRAVEQAAGVSAQMTDIVAQQGLDPGARQIAVPIGTVAEAVGTFTYTVLGGGRIAPDPAWVASHIATEQVPILGTVTCNRFVIPQLREALLEIQATGLADEIHPGEYAGCYYPRFIAGSTTLSNHSFGLALDLNTPGNQRGTVGEMHPVVVSIFKKWGFAWGGDWNYTDPMHFEMNRLVEPG